MSPSTQPSGFSLRLEQGKDVTFPHWSLNIPHNEPVLIIQKLDSDLSHLTSGSSPTHNFHHDCVLHLRFHPAQVTNNISKTKFSHKSRHENIWTSMQIIDKNIVLRIWGFNLLQKYKPTPTASFQSNTIWTTPTNTNVIILSLALQTCFA